MKKSVRDIDVAGKRTLVRVDFNVPLRDGVVQDDTRIKAALPTIRYLMDQGARVMILSHLGRPSGEGFEVEFSLLPVVDRLSELLGMQVQYAAGLTGPDVEEAVLGLEDGEVLLLENVRFDHREQENDPTFAAELAGLADIFVNDAFGASHREHASTVGVAGLLPSVSGELMAREVETITEMMSDPKRPFVAILGGSKVSDKIGLMESLMDRCDVILVGGGMCFTFLKSLGYEIGTSICEDSRLGNASALLAKAKEIGVSFMLPEDIVAASAFSENADIITCTVNEIPQGMMGLDIGPKTAENYADIISTAGTIFWNGPMGVFEMEPFAHGTEIVARAVAANADSTSIIGGGDSVCAIKKYGLADEVTFISTGGGASMRLVEGKPLPGLEVLDDLG